MPRVLRILLLVSVVASTHVCGQELNATIKINHSQIQGTDVSVFDNLEETLTRFVNETQWTNLQYQQNERIVCTFNITVTKYEAPAFSCRAVVTATRPVYNSSYTTTTYSNTDSQFDFEFSEFDQIFFNENNLDNNLTALFAYYAFLIIGIDLDSFGEMAGEDVLQRCFNLCNNAQNLNFPGWKAFDSDRNRYAIINDYLDGAMRPFRQLQYDYYRKGLDEMVTNAERGRTNITDAIENDLQKAHKDRPMSMLPQIWTDYKKDELANIYKGKGTPKEKETVYDILFNINASQSNAWEKIKE